MAMMPRLLVLDADTPELDIEVSKDRFVFLKTNQGKIYHCDLTDGKMWEAQPDLMNLGEAHRKLFKSDPQKFLCAACKMGFDTFAELTKHRENDECFDG